MIMKEDFVGYDLAVKLKEKGFPQVEKNTLAMYNEDGEWFSLATNLDTFEYSFEDFDDKDCVCPTIYQVLKWLREEKKIFVAINIGYCYESDGIPFPINHKMEPILKGYYFGICELDNLNDKNARSEYFEDYEHAVLEGIDYVLDNWI